MGTQQKAHGDGSELGTPTPTNPSRTLGHGGQRQQVVEEGRWAT